MHRWVKRWMEQGVFEEILRAAGSLVEERDGYRFYECFIDTTFSKAKGGGDGIGLTRVGKGVKIMVLLDAHGLPAAVNTAFANRAESHLAQQLFDFMIPESLTDRVVGDNAYNSDALDEILSERGIELIAPHRSNRLPENKTQDGRSLRRCKRR